MNSDRLVNLSSLFLAKASAEDHDILYHVTFFKNMPSIAAEGLKPGAGSSIGQGAGYKDHSTGNVFLTEFNGVIFWYGKAEDWAEHSSDNVYEDELVPVVLRIFLDDESLSEDELGFKDSGYNEAFKTKQGIPPEHMEVWSGSKWIDVEDYNSIDILDALIVEENEESEEDEDSEEYQGSEDTLYWFNPEHPLMPTSG
jgi:hypothetical protein